jgi:hypothetical protein
LRQLLIAIALLTLAPALSLAAGTHGFQLEVDALGSIPTGTYEFGGHASDLFDFGGAVFGKALFGMSRGLSIGAGVGYLTNSKDFTETSLLDTRPPRNWSGTRTLGAIPVLAMAQLRSDTHKSLSWYGEGGLGMTTFDLRVTNLSSGRPPSAEFQQGFSILVGAGACWGLGRNFEVLAGADYLQSFTRAGDLWENGDNPAYLLASLGLRYPRW